MLRQDFWKLRQDIYDNILDYWCDWSCDPNNFTDDSGASHRRTGILIATKQTFILAKSNLAGLPTRRLSNYFWQQLLRNQKSGGFIEAPHSLLSTIQTLSRITLVVIVRIPRNSLSLWDPKDDCHKQRLLSSQLTVSSQCESWTGHFCNTQWSVIRIRNDIYLGPRFSENLSECMVYCKNVLRRKLNAPGHFSQIWVWEKCVQNG